MKLVLLLLLAGAAIFAGRWFLDEGRGHDLMTEDLLKSNLHQLMGAQDAFAREHGTFADSLAQLPGSLFWSTGVTIRITADSNRGWSARATYPSHEAGEELECAVYVGAAAPPLPRMTERKTRCR